MAVECPDFTSDRTRQTLSTGEKSMNWRELTIAIVGGDRREQEIARCASATGAAVKAYGFPWPAEGIPNVTLETRR